MRDLIVLVFTCGSAVVAFGRPWIGVLALAVLAYLNPHRYAWGFSRSLPVYFIVFIATVIGLMNTNDRQPFPWTRETKLFVLLLAWFTMTSFMFPEFPGAAKEQWVKVMKIYIGIFPTFWLINSRDRIHWLVIAITLSFGLIGLKGGIFALGTGFSYRVWGPDNTFYGGNNEIALALCMILPLALLCAKEAKQGLVRYLFYAVFFFSMCSVISSWSRGGLLALSAVLGAIIWTSKRKWLAVPLLLIGLFLFVPMLPQEWFNRMHTIETYEEDESAQSRLRVWQEGWETAVNKPLTGGGFGTYYGTDAHSAYFEVLGEQGFIALGLWLSLLFGTMGALQRIRKKALEFEGLEWIRDYARAIQVGLLGYAVGGAFLGVAYWDIFYHLVAICVLLKLQLQREAESKGLLEPSLERGHFNVFES